MECGISTNLVQLNADCWHRIFFYLPIVDQLKFHCITKDFDNVIISFLKTEEVFTSKMRQSFSAIESRNILTEFGTHIRHLNIDEQIEDANIEFYQFLPNICTNLISITFYYPTPAANRIYKQILSVTVQLESICFREYNWSKHRGDPQEYIPGAEIESGIVEMLLGLGNLKKLHFWAYGYMTGYGFHHLPNLIDLSLVNCNAIGKDTFKQLFLQRKLKRLNVFNCNCLEFDGEIVKMLVKTQDELSSLIISNDLKNVEIIGQLKNLKHLMMYGYKSKRRPGNDWLNELVSYHANDLETLHFVEFYSPDSYSKILLFKNLIDLRLPEKIDNNYLAKIVKNLSKLKKLQIRIDIADPEYLKEGTFIVATQLQHLKELILFSYYPLDHDFYLRIIEARKKLLLNSLCISISNGCVPKLILESDEYAKNRNYLQLKELPDYYQLNKSSVAQKRTAQDFSEVWRTLVNDRNS